MMRSMKGIPIHRKNIIHSRKSIEIAQERIKDGYHIAIFPEGTRTITGRLSQFKKGGFHMAVNAKVKILPVIVKGLYDIKPKTRWTIDTSIRAEMIFEKPINLEATDILKLNASAASSLEAFASILEMT